MFSADKWGKATRSYLVSINRLTTSQMEEIIDASKLFSTIKTSSVTAGNTNADTDPENDPRSQLLDANGSATSDDDFVKGSEGGEGGGGHGWGLVPSSMYPGSDCDPVEPAQIQTAKGKGKARERSSYDSE